VINVSNTSRFAPRALLADPWRSRAAAIAGAELGVDTIASSAFGPSTSV
jgi:hypothetical protein